MRLDKIRQEFGVKDESIYLMRSLVVMARNPAFRKLLDPKIAKRIIESIPNQKRKLNAIAVLKELLKKDEYKKNYTKGSLKQLVIMILKGQTDHFAKYLVNDVLNAKNRLESKTTVVKDAPVETPETPEKTEEKVTVEAEKKTISVKVTEKKNNGKKAKKK